MHVYVGKAVVKEEEFTEEELMEQDPLEVAGTPLKKEKIENDEQIFVKNKFNDEDYDLKSDINVI